MIPWVVSSRSFAWHNQGIKKGIYSATESKWFHELCLLGPLLDISNQSIKKGFCRATESKWLHELCPLGHLLDVSNQGVKKGFCCATGGQWFHELSFWSFTWHNQTSRKVSAVPRCVFIYQPMRCVTGKRELIGFIKVRLFQTNLFKYIYFRLICFCVVIVRVVLWNL